MHWWHAGLAVLYDAGPSPENNQTGQWMHVDSIYREIVRRKLKMHKGKTPANTLGAQMRKGGSQFIERSPLRPGMYRVQSRTEAEAYIMKHHLWLSTEEADQVTATTEHNEVGTAPTKNKSSNRSSRGRSNAPTIKKTVVHLIPEEVNSPRSYVEGGSVQLYVNGYERNRKARDECVRHYGYICQVCKGDLAAVYGELGKNYIHVHHLKRIAKRGGRYTLDAISDLCPICPNCHAMIHRKDPPYSVAELQAILEEVERTRR